MCPGSLSPKKEVELRALNPLLKQGFAPLCPCHDRYLTLFTRGKKTGRLLCFCCSFCFRGQTQGCRKCLNCSPPMSWGFPGGSVSEESICNAGDRLQHRRPSFNPWVRKIPWRRKWRPTQVFLPGESHGPRNLVGYSA